MRESMLKMHVKPELDITASLIFKISYIRIFAGSNILFRIPMLLADEACVIPVKPLEIERAHQL
ncbi:hypothetical protein C3L33_06462, partial [Rhododendron williamsianum]